LTSKERFLTAIRNGVPDRVPVTPDISNYLPCKRTGRPFWDIYFHREIPLWRAYLEAAAHFGIDAWMASCTGVPYVYEEADVETSVDLTYDEGRDAMVRTTRWRTPAGDLSRAELCFRYDPPSPIEKQVKELARDFEALRWVHRPPKAIDHAAWTAMAEASARHGHAFGVSLGYPGFHQWHDYVQEGVVALSYAEMDRPAVLERWYEFDLERGSREMALILAARPDYIQFGGSGTITMASPGLARKYALPALKQWSRMAREAGIPTLLHSCGKSRCLVEMLAEETDVGCVNPLEEPPMGDVDLAEVKRTFGDRLALMGNLHTTDVMLNGSASVVKRKAKAAIRAAGDGGGFVLSTGDQCGRETPEANLFAMLEAAEEVGVY
jgi:uroporphyrinogen decarboxylase